MTGQPRNCLAATTGSLTTLVFSVAASSAAPLSYQWLKDGIPLNNSGRYSGVATGTLTIAGAATGDITARYSVRVTNAGGYATSAAASLEIGTPYAVEPARPVVVAGHAISLEARGVPGHPDPQPPVTWQRLAPGSGNWADITGGGATATRLWLENVQPAQDGASYRFIAQGAPVPAVTLRVLPDLAPSPSGVACSPAASGLL
ncbi:MAG: immunoglobulin domain-containing protein, partial [Opitutaceae bacterium]|nr:immunoglobulin domain-containing protein [Opitutaceae bacterium]